MFTRRVVADCMTHRCTMHDDAHREARRVLPVRLRRRSHRARRDPRARRVDPPGARRRRRRTCRGSTSPTPSRIPTRRRAPSCARPSHDGGCLFLSHDRRGCAIHRASLEQGWDFRGVKPTICRLFPLTYGEGRSGSPTTITTTRAPTTTAPRRCIGSRATRSPTSSAPTSCARWTRPRPACSPTQPKRLRDAAPSSEPPRS